MRLSSFTYDNAAPAPIADLVVVFFDHDVRRELPVPLTEIAVSGSLAGAIASLRIEHHFAIPSEPGSASLDRRPVIDARYTFPIPGDAAVHGVTMHFGDEEIKAVLRERQEARDEFERAKKTGRAAVLVNDSGRGVLRLEVTGITPGVPLRVSTDLVVLPRREADGSTTLRIPLTAAPRYTRADEDETAADASPKAISAKVGYRATLELTAPAGIELSSPTHDITVTTEGGRQIAKFAGSVLPDRDLVVVSRAPAGLSVSGQVILGETRNGRTPWLATVVAPVRAPTATAPGASGIGVPRSLILLVDRSGSMRGEKWSAAEWATRSLIAGMRDDDNMLVAAFDTSLERNTEGWHGMTKLARRTMTEWIRTISPRGGTELGSALEELLRQELRPGTQHELLIVTDGAVSPLGGPRNRRGSRRPPRANPSLSHATGLEGRRPPRLPRTCSTRLRTARGGTRIMSAPMCPPRPMGSKAIGYSSLPPLLVSAIASGCSEPCLLSRHAGNTASGCSLLHVLCVRHTACAGCGPDRPVRVTGSGCRTWRG